MKTFYAINLNNKRQGLSRWAIYHMTKDGMAPLWPKHINKDMMEPLLPNQKYCELKQYPAYHFQCKGYGLNHLDSLARGLCAHFKCDIRLEHLHGWHPSVVTCEYVKGFIA